MAEAPNKREPAPTEAQELRNIQREVGQAETRVLRLQDQMAIMMLAATVLMAVATGLSAWATWRYEEITRRIFAISDRPYVGVQGINLRLDDPKMPCAVLDYRNYGDLPAEHSMIQAWASVDGKVVSFDPLRRGLGPKVKLDLGTLSPHTPHLFGAYFPPQYTEPILKGDANLELTIIVAYKDAAEVPYCYRMNFRYFAPLKSFDPDGGSNHCDGLDP
jgi:hypothetical protein